MLLVSYQQCINRGLHLMYNCYKNLSVRLLQKLQNLLIALLLFALKFQFASTLLVKLTSTLASMFIITLIFIFAYIVPFASTFLFAFAFNLTFTPTLVLTFTLDSIFPFAFAFNYTFIVAFTLTLTFVSIFYIYICLHSCLHLHLRLHYVHLHLYLQVQKSNYAMRLFTNYGQLFQPTATTATELCNHSVMIILTLFDNHLKM